MTKQNHNGSTNEIHKIQTFNKKQNKWLPSCNKNTLSTLNSTFDEEKTTYGHRRKQHKIRNQSFLIMREREREQMYMVTPLYSHPQFKIQTTPIEGASFHSIRPVYETERKEHRSHLTTPVKTYLHSSLLARWRYGPWVSTSKMPPFNLDAPPPPPKKKTPCISSMWSPNNMDTLYTAVTPSFYTTKTVGQASPKIYMYNTPPKCLLMAPPWSSLSSVCPGSLHFPFIVTLVHGMVWYVDEHEWQWISMNS